MGMNLSREQVQKVLGTPGVIVSGGEAASPHRVRGMNRTERAWSDVLTIDADVDAWLYESVTLKLGPDCRYTPDFFVVTTAGRFELHEVKGFRREDAMVKLRVAAGMFTWFRFFLVEKRQGQWTRKEIHP